MANILSDRLVSNKNTPVFPVATNYSSSTRGDGLESANRLVITNTTTNISKSGDTLSIGKEKFEIAHKNVLDVVLLLQSKGVNIKFLDNSLGWNLPAACIIDFTNEEFKQDKLTHIPFNLESLNILTNKGIESYEPTVIKPEIVMDTYNNKKTFTVNENYLTEVKDFTKEHKIVYRVFSSSFLIKINDNKFTTTKSDVLTKYMDVLHRND